MVKHFATKKWQKMNAYSKLGAVIFVPVFSFNCNSLVGTKIWKLIIRLIDCVTHGGNTSVWRSSRSPTFFSFEACFVVSNIFVGHQGIYHFFIPRTVGKRSCRWVITFTIDTRIWLILRRVTVAAQMISVTLNTAVRTTTISQNMFMLKTV